MRGICEAYPELGSTDCVGFGCAARELGIIVVAGEGSGQVREAREEGSCRFYDALSE